MKAILTILVLTLAAPLLAQQPSAKEGRGRFWAVDIYIDSRLAPLAAYQLQFRATKGIAKIVGIEGGEHPLFAEPPHYDPKAMQSDRVILAAFSLAPGDKLPQGKTRVATIHLHSASGEKPEFKIDLHTAASPSGEPISAEANVEERTSK